MQSKKKIVIVGPAHPYRGGQALVEAYLYNMLSSMGYDCHTFSYKLLYPSMFFPGTTQYDNSEIIPFEHKERIRFTINSVNPLTWYKTAREIKKMKPDGVIFVWWMPFFGPALSTIARLIKRKTRAKVIFLVENYVSHEKRWFDRFATLFTLKHADAFISESGFVTKQVQGDFPEKPLYQATLSVYDCYDLKKYDMASARAELNIKTKNVVLFFGLIRPYKGLETLIKAFRQLLEKEPDTTLLIVGECYDDEKKYLSLIAEEGISDKAIFINKFIPNEKVEIYFKAADVLCMPYHSGTQSGILMMAYGFGIPVVATDVGGIAELVNDGETGKIVPDNSPANLVNAIAHILESKDQVDYKENIRAYIEGTGYSGMSQFFDKLLTNQPA